MPKYWVAKSRIPEIQKKADALHKKAMKNKLESFTFGLTGEERLDVNRINNLSDVNHHIDNLAKLYRKNGKLLVGTPMVEIEIEGSVPVIDNWQFFAKIEHMGREADTKKYINLVQISPFLRGKKDQFLPIVNAYEDCPPNCDHCNTVRRRNATFLVKNTIDGSVKQVGGTCVDDFIAQGTLDQALLHYKINDFIKDIDSDEYEYGGSSLSYFDSVSALALACYFVKNNGFAKSSEDNSTRGLVSRHLMFLGDYLDKDAIKILTDIACDADNEYVNDAKKVIEKTMNEPRNSEYTINAQNIIKSGYVDVSKGSALGILSSIPKSYYEDLAKDSLEFKEEFGFEPKARGMMQLKVVEKNDKPYADYPYSNYTMMDAEGIRFSLKSYYNSYTDMEMGKTYQMKATVKDHNESSGKKYTNINRVAELKEVEEGTTPPDFKPAKKTRAKKPTESSLSM